ncbi:hypothetical protein [Brachyspira sp. SAP_772]|uniref:hypothetical protein n=1 Tax=Brachyspira sp. SAP_772 TaxID=2608385 RepID=UPI0012F4E3B1|nr:hypothetical protein [Brachyspira sp. SAP_772]
MASKNKDISYNSLKDNKKNIIPSLEDIKNSNKNIYIIESISGREKEKNKDYKIRKILLEDIDTFDYDIKNINKKETKIDKKNIYKTISNIEGFCFLSVDAFIEYYNYITNKKIETQNDINKIKDKLKQKSYREQILPAYKLKSKENDNYSFFYVLEELEILDFLIDNLEFGTKIRNILNAKYIDYVDFIEKKIKALVKHINKIDKQDNDEIYNYDKVYYDYKLYYMPFFIYDYFKQKKITEKDYCKLLEVYKKEYESLIKKEDEKYVYYGEEVENKRSYYNIDLLKRYDGFVYDYDFKEYINLHYKLIDYQIEHKRYLKRYIDFFSSQIIVFLYFLGHISRDDFLGLREKIKKLEEISLPLKKESINLKEDEENIIFEVSSNNDFNRVLVDYIELYNFTRLYYNKNIKLSYDKNIKLILKSSEFKKILKY